VSTLIFLDHAFQAPGVLPGEAELAVLIPGAFGVTSADALAESLDQISTLVSFHGPYFPKDAWPALRRFFDRGGSFVCFGGAPFTTPCLDMRDAWAFEVEQVAYMQEVRIRQAYAVDTSDVGRWEAAAGAAFLQDANVAVLPRGTAYALTVRFTENNDHPDHLGSSGPMDARLIPLVYGIGHEGTPVVAPVVAIDHLQGKMAGSRWVLGTFAAPEGWWAEPEAQALVQRLVAFAAEGALAVRILPEMAGYHPGELPALQVWMRHFSPHTQDVTLDVALVSPVGKVIHRQEVPVAISATAWYGRVALPPAAETGLYRAVVTLTGGQRQDQTFEIGYWVYTPGQLAAGPPVTVDAQGFHFGGKPAWVAGTTYMASDVQRKFFALPNPAVWDRDMGAISATGMNIIRTGLWTAWRQIMWVPGTVPEAIMRAFDAFLLTARKHNLAVIFNFWAFTPETFEGENPYLDPRALAGQRDFIAAFARRWKDVPDLIWDFINEPSFSSPKRIFTFRPTSGHDRFDQQAFAGWLQKRHHSLASAQQAWRVTPAELPSFAAATLPDDKDYREDVSCTEPQRAMRLFDYTLFSQEAVNEWALDLRQTLRNCGAMQVVTIGQDEAEARPTAPFHADSVEFTTNHSWWKMDDLLWDAVYAKVPGKPLVIEETGIMFTKEIDNRARRSEQECANLLERKCVHAHAGGGVGVIQWLWNTNHLMHSDNEVAIGACRADGSEKPEAGVMRDHARFLAKVGPAIQDDPQVVLVLPHSYLFSNRNGASEATKRAVRTLAYQLGVVPTAVGEYRIAQDLRQPALIILPSARVLTREAWEGILRAVEAGSTLLATGPMEEDEYWLPADRLSPFGWEPLTSAVAREEAFELDGRVYRCAYPGDKISRVEKAVMDDEAFTLLEAPHGNGRILWTGLPLELAETDALAVVYQRALEIAGLQSNVRLESNSIPALMLVAQPVEGGTLYCAVNEGGSTYSAAFTDILSGQSFALTLPSERGAMAFVNGEGRLAGTFGGGAWLAR